MGCAHELTYNNKLRIILVRYDESTFNLISTPV